MYFIVWYCKTLQNWKALLARIYERDKYFELAYNGDEKELYLDVWQEVRKYVLKGLTIQDEKREVVKTSLLFLL